MSASTEKLHYAVAKANQLLKAYARSRELKFVVAEWSEELYVMLVEKESGNVLHYYTLDELGPDLSYLTSPGLIRNRIG